MGGDGARLPLAVAQKVAAEVELLLAPACEMLDTVGSVRRLAAEVGDLEVLAVSKLGTEQADLVSTRTFSLLERRVAELLAGGRLQPHPVKPANGQRYKKLWLADPGIQLDLFIVDGPRCRLCTAWYPAALAAPSTCKHEWVGSWWGPAYCVRTGPADFSKAMVTVLRERGMHLDELAVKKLGGGEVTPCPTEREFFRLCGRPYMPPEYRT
jgi:DNA polymerase/3'-5' exonuclease PolX